VQFALALDSALLNNEKLGVKISTAPHRVDGDADLYESSKLGEIDEHRSAIAASRTARLRRMLHAGESAQHFVTPGLRLGQVAERASVGLLRLSPA
jgi:hypothetical protein